MDHKKEYEIIQHTAMNNLEFFLIELVSRNPHGHSDLEIGILLEGSVELLLENKRILLEKNDIYVINRYQVHSFLKTDTPNVILAFQIHAEFYKNVCSNLTRIQFENIVNKTRPLYPLLRQTLFNCAQVYFKETEYFELKCASLLMDALHILTQCGGNISLSEKEYGQARSSALRLNRITDYISEHYTERLMLEDISELEGITTFHASHFMKKMLGVSFQNYLNTLRFEHAYRLAAQTALTILDLCMESGFSSSRYLNQMFVKRLGMTVTEFRRLKKAVPLAPPSLPTDNRQRRLTFDEAGKVLEKISFPDSADCICLNHRLLVPTSML